ncbi:hypothetical protein BB558_003412 [Smittium angustum]|uniref:Uncharacterized protein n=1 Tax=Smittium angustum TaxID=133377 RepID=A0A2U1J6D0_SMIAN|nr:hypothetical protein BB558_003412 [Smittium angustum]
MYIPSPTPQPSPNDSQNQASLNRDIGGTASSDSPYAASQPGVVPNQPNNYNTPAGTCKFPWAATNSDNVYPVTPDQSNGGWAMSPNQLCTKGSWCPYACKPGYYAAQWDPSASLYNGQGSMNGGLYCDNNGVLQVPFPNQYFCVKSMNNTSIRNTLGKPVSACQTVYPGNEAMIIPSVAQPGSSVDLNIVPSSYWLGTSSQFYVNLADSDQNQCIWGTPDKPVGNWGPYIFGGGQAKDGNTYISLTPNPLYKEVGFNYNGVYNVKIACTAGSCNFPPTNECKCENGVCSMGSGCTVTLGPGAKAEYVLY